MHPRATNTTVPPIPTPGTRQLACAIDVLRLRLPELDHDVAAIRSGDNTLLMTYVRRTQHGDSEAAQVAIWAVLPRMCAVLRSRLPRALWRSAADDLLALLYLTIIDISPGEPPAFLSDKLISRARRRYERNLTRQNSTAQHELVTDLAPAVADDVEQRALARIDLDTLRDAINRGAVSAHTWNTIVTARFDDREEPVPGNERMTLLRAQRRLELWRLHAA